MDNHESRLAALSPEQKKLLELRTKRLEKARNGQGIVPPQADAQQSTHTSNAVETEGMQFSLFFFSADEAALPQDKYRFIIEAAKYADTHGFTAIWTPERHFEPFGGLYPNPAVLSSALAMVTSQLQIRAGSVVLPLTHPVRVVEEWALIDNLSQGRAGIAFASGWSPEDFIFAPQAYTRRKEIMFQQIETIRRLWNGEEIQLLGGGNQEFKVHPFPRPVQHTLPIWITSGGSQDTYIKAGEIGANLLTALLSQSIEEAAEKIALYRAALANHGYDPYSRRVTLMLHTCIGDSVDDVREKVHEPLSRYLRSFLNLYENAAQQMHIPIDVTKLTESDRDALASFAFERYFTTSGLFGTPESCLKMIQRLKKIGVDEVACLLDFGIDFELISASLHHLYQLKNLSNSKNEIEIV